MQENELILATEMERILGTDRKGIYRRVHNRTLPKPLRICGRLCWRRSDWANWLDQEAQRQGAAVAPALAEPKPRRRGRPTKAEAARRGQK